MGFGHRVYKNYDPRARIIKKHVRRGARGDRRTTRCSRSPRELEKRALDDDYFTSRKLYPNVDFYSGLIYEALEIPTDMFTVIFAIPRTSGWVAQWMEHERATRSRKIARPRQISTGAVAAMSNRKSPGENRQGPGEDHGPAGEAPEAPAPRRLRRRMRRRARRRAGEHLDPDDAARPAA